MKRINITVREEDYKLAKKLGINISEVARRALKQAIDEELHRQELIKRAKETIKRYEKHEGRNN